MCKNFLFPFFNFTFLSVLYIVENVGYIYNSCFNFYFCSSHHLSHFWILISPQYGLYFPAFFHA